MLSWAEDKIKVRELMRARRYAEVIAHLRQELGNSPENIAAIEVMAQALRANEEYAEALVFFERLAAHDREDKVANTLAPGRAAWQIDIACLHWLADDHSRAVELMHGLAAGILDGSIKYGDAAGGMSQGLLLYYMAITDHLSKEALFALDYLRNRIKRILGQVGPSPAAQYYISQVWPSPVARYYSGDVAFDEVMEAVNRQPTLAKPDQAKLELGRRRRLSVALFHDGLRFRARDDEGNCLARMRECCRLENPMIEQEWYLARYEVRKADGG